MKRPIVVYETLNKIKIKVKLHPNSSQEKIEKKSKEKYEVWLKEKPIDNKANETLVKVLKKYFGKEVRIKSGLTSRNKIVEVVTPPTQPK